eukprot:TRINITY_DN15399_c0_g5_i1.p1 TRINITY_DN15399_c0_g5~~TRINITY_DN15399_c0_g5_i1.p1  ORF type:complete len:151 (+),score=25.30 TRINITY_DN15399_c0_g5_i1:507-959(+)
MAGVLVNDLEQEIEKLKREYENLKLKRKREKVTKGEYKEPLRKPELFAELKYDDELAIDYDNLEEVIEEHKEKLKRLEAEYYGQSKVLAVKENESIPYEELRNLRVKFAHSLRRKSMKCSSNCLSNNILKCRRMVKWRSCLLYTSPSPRD